MPVARHASKGRRGQACYDAGLSGPHAPRKEVSHPMPNIAALLKTEIARVARKEVKAQIEALKKTVTAQRGQIAALKKRADDADKQLKRLGKPAARGAAPKVEEAEDDEGAAGMRFSAKGFKTRRKKLGLSAEDLGLLLGVTGQSIYKWEDGRARPRGSYMPAIAAFRTMGKREITQRLEALRAQG